MIITGGRGTHHFTITIIVTICLIILIRDHHHNRLYLNHHHHQHHDLDYLDKAGSAKVIERYALQFVQK